VSVVQAGILNTPSGKLLAHDPCSLSYVEPSQGFIRKVKPGQYPVLLSVLQPDPALGSEDFICAAMVRFLDEPITTWEIALRPGEEADVTDDTAPAHSVDSGLSCFADLDSICKMSEDDREAIFEDLLAEQLEGSRCDFAVAEVNKKTKASIVVFASAFGDGGYSDYWGLTKSGAIAALATDFFVLIEDFFVEVEFNLLAALQSPANLNHPQLQVLNLNCTVEKLAQNKLKVVLVGPTDTHEGRIKIVGSAPAGLEEQAFVTESMSQGDHYELIFQLPAPLTENSLLHLNLRTGMRPLA